MRLRGIEPPHMAPEAIALSTELQTHWCYYSVKVKKLQVVLKNFFEKFLWKKFLNFSILQTKYLRPYPVSRNHYQKVEKGFCAVRSCQMEIKHIGNGVFKSG